ncbi:FAD-dependent monooxygenase [Lentzea nigeriaca]|uniref:FAD-dependent monooxygenase n=1 Tax=Lentzea nigeriaca TaxID=1128665 RepID=UPI00195BCAA1|nr:FAD-dependent monooxygenase [Lentzea nigeriaca]MBM7863238.1 3-(3-hydroxy-phenyl)propionate hydroxylase [Lentzea nigeriaca]
MPDPVIVVGAGPVGLCAALALRAHDVPVVLLEADPVDRHRTGSRALYVHGKSLALLESISQGAGSELAARGVLWNVRRTLYRGKQVYEKEFPPHDPASGLPPFTSLRQSETEHVLLDACERAGVDVRWNHPVTEVVTHPGGVTVATADGVTWSGSHVVGADGARSTVRRCTGTSLNGTAAEGFHVVVDVADSTPDLARVMHYEHPAAEGRGVLIVPYANGFQVDVQSRAGDSADVIASRQEVRRWLPALIGPTPTERITAISVYRFLQLIADDFTDPHHRILLVGEAAHLFPPFGARGMNSGFVDAQAAADAITTGRHSPAANAEAVAAFATTRHAAAEANSAAAGAALRHLRPPTAAARLRRGAAARLASVVPRFGEWLEHAPYGTRLSEVRH